MSDEVLNKNQVEGLLRAMEEQDRRVGGAGDEEPETVGSSGPRATRSSSRRPRPAAPANPLDPRSRTTAYDFKRPERVGKEQMRAMHSLHESLARSLGASLSTTLRSMIEVKLTGANQLTYSEFIFSLDNPSCFTVFQPSPLEGSWILDISPPLSYAIIDRMLGGDPTPGETIRRPLTEIENRLIGRVVRVFLDHLKESWENIVSLDCQVERVESNPQLVQIVPPNEVVILVGFEVVLGRNRGMIHLCIPFNSIERFNAKLSNNGWVGYNRSRPTSATRQSIARSVDAAPVELVVTLARSQIKTRDLLDLSVGDIITTEQTIDQPLEIAIQDVPKLRGRAGSLKGKKAIRIEGEVQLSTSRTAPSQSPEVKDAGESTHQAENQEGHESA